MCSIPRVANAIAVATISARLWDLEIRDEIGSKPYAKLKIREVNGARMAYVDEGEGDAIVFQHGQLRLPWRCSGNWLDMRNRSLA
jgi:hypothetical protein